MYSYFSDLSNIIPKRSIQYLHDKFNSIDVKADDWETVVVDNIETEPELVCKSASQWTNYLIKPKTANDMTDWSFQRKVQCPKFYLSKYPTIRPRVSLSCDSNNPQLTVTHTTSTHDVDEVEFGNKCLNDVIQRCCLGDQQVPNVVHYIWYSDKELGYFQFLSFMSALRFMKPCLFLIHGNYLPKGEYWDHFISVSPNVIHVKRSKPKSVFGHKLSYEEHASDVMRIEALIGK